MDNLRYISLQYIKGDNYEKIQCFKYEETLELLEEIKDKRNYSRPTLDKLEGVMEEDKCLVGESFLNDLVNYYNFKDIKECIEDVKKHIEYAGYDSKDGVKRKILLKNLDELINAVGKLGEKNIGEGINNTIPDNSVSVDWLEKGKKLINKRLIPDVSKIYDTFVKSAGEYGLSLSKWDTIQRNGVRDENGYNEEIKKFATFLVNEDYSDINRLKVKIIENINLVLNEKEGTKEHLVMFLKALKVVLLYEDSQSAIMALFNNYIKICKRNIGKYEELFNKNDISNIDDAFMIKSYATFLNKLETLKKNLESKDQTKLERALTNALERLFDLYGINNPDDIITTTKNNYFYEHILNT
jgi:predicted Fe-Mo cluster-binding NifX family protein